MFTTINNVVSRSNYCKKTGEGEDAKVTEITWSGGSIPAGFRDDFTFSAQAPAKEGSIQWKAYQTYQGGEIAAWDQEPKGDHAEGVKPYSETKVKNDLGAATKGDDRKDGDRGSKDAEKRANTALAVGALGLIVAAGALATRKKK